jgi:cytochrome oxidase Cu insertion factor (SCO1/SenC/PrrC family)
MPGMNSGLNISDPQVVSAFVSALLHQGLVGLLIFATLGVAWLSARMWTGHPIHSSGDTGSAPGGTAAVAGDSAEPVGRQVLWVGFGLLWLFDGILQAQPKMAVGLPSQVIEPTAASSPHWVQAVVNWAGTTWSYHPIQAGAAAVWIQVGIGVWLLASPRGSLSRLAGLVSAAWGLVVWVFGESFGGIFAPGLTWQFGAPGAALVYVVAGALIALPGRAWHTPRLGRAVLGGTGLFLIGMAVLQAWPGRGFWQGISGGQPGTLPAMTTAMAQAPQPGFLSAIVSAFTTFDEAHGFAVNLAAVAALAVTGLAFLTPQPRLVRVALNAFTVFCLADWLLIEDLGFLGGLGTDPNSMLPMIFLAAAGYLALVRVPEPAAAVTAAGTRAARWPDLVRPGFLGRGLAGASFRSIVADGAAALIVLGAAPMAIAQASPNADPILAQAISGQSVPLRTPAAGFTLTDQAGRAVSLASLRGKVILLSFLDPVCTTDCALIGAELRQASQLMRADADQVEIVGIVLNPSYRSRPVVRAFDRQEGLDTVPNWVYLTGPLTALRKVWGEYGMVAVNLPGGAMTSHNDDVFVISRRGLIVREFSSDPGPGTTATMSSYSVLFATAVRQALK